MLTLLHVPALLDFGLPHRLLDAELLLLKHDTFAVLLADIFIDFH
jgi:hypothetical protein